MSHRSANPSFTVTALAELSRTIRERVDSGISTGIVAGLLSPDGQAELIAYGDAADGKRLDPDDVFEIGSITKLFTGTLLSEMAQRGEVALDDPVAALLPAQLALPTHDGRQITLLDLATHASGLVRDPTNHVPQDPANPEADYSVEQLYAFLAAQPPTAGSRSEYSNLGVGLLGHALALRAGTSYEGLLRERILAPLGMDATAITLTASLADRFVAGHNADGRAVGALDLPTLAGCGALRSTVADLLTFAAASLDGGPEGSLGRALQAARSPRFEVDERMRIALSWLIDRPAERELHWHNGRTAGHASFIALDPERQTAVALLCNTATGVEDLGFHALDEQAPVLSPPMPIELSAAQLDRYVGVYELPDAEVRLTRSENRLTADIPGQPPADLYPRADTEFFLRVLEADVRFELDDRHNVTGALYRADGQTISLKKIA